MIARLKGILIEKNPPHIVLDVAGVGYEVAVPMSTFYNLPSTGESVTLLTQFVVREDAQLLYGFATAPEREGFRALVKVSGVGARTALAVLSGMSMPELAQAVTLQEVGRLTAVPGIGKKTAERMLLELKGKLGGDFAGVAGLSTNLGTAGTPEQNDMNDIARALVALGYSEKEAVLALKAVPADTGVNDGIRLALKSLSKH